MFFVGLDDLHHARHFDDVFISVHRLKKRKSFTVNNWIMDSGAFSTINMCGGYPDPVENYAAEIRKWKDNGNLLAAVTQDYMCEPFMVEKTGLSIAEHQRLTVERYDTLMQCDVGGVYIMPVLQGQTVDEYLSHIDQYGERLKYGAWVGVGSVCKRNRNRQSIETLLLAIKEKRPDLRLHGFGLKITALRSGLTRSLLYSADSMAWSFSARMGGGNAHDYRTAQRWIEKLKLNIDIPIQGRLAI